MVGKGGQRAVSRVREEICFVANHFFHYRLVQVAQYLGVSPSGVTGMRRRALKAFLTDQAQLQRIKKLLLAG